VKISVKFALKNNGNVDKILSETHQLV